MATAVMTIVNINKVGRDAAQKFGFFYYATGTALF